MKTILLPLCAQVILTLLVWLWMYYTRLTTLAKSKARTQDLADDKKFDAILKDVVNPSDNLENLFEMPVLFYVACIVLFITNSVDSPYLGLAWAFVGFRTVHSIIHCFSNIIIYRFSAYLLSSIVLWTIWIRISIFALS